MENKIKKGTFIKLRKDLKVGEIYGGIYFTEQMKYCYPGGLVGTIDNILPNNVFTTIEYKKDNYYFSYDMIDYIITLDDFKIGDRIMNRVGDTGTVIYSTEGKMIKYDFGLVGGYSGIDHMKIKSEEKIHIDEDNESKCIDKWKEINNNVDSLEEIAELYKEQIEVVSIIQKKLEEIIKKHDGFNIDIDVTIDNKIREKLKETINRLKELDS